MKIRSLLFILLALTLSACGVLLDKTSQSIQTPVAPAVVIEAPET